MHFLAISLRKDWARVRRDPFSFLIALGIPVILAALMTVIFGHEPAIPRGRLLIADEDRTFASAGFLTAFRSRQVANMVTVEATSRDSGRARMNRGEASALLIVPAGFQEAFAGNRPMALPLFVNPSQRILPQILQETLSVALDGVSYLRRGARLPQRADLSSGLITLQTSVVHEQARSLNFATLFLPSMLFMGMMFLANSLSFDIWRERMTGTLRRLASSPIPMAAYLAARLVFVAIFYFVVALCGLLAAQMLAGMPVSNLPAAVLWVTFAGVVFYLLFVCLTMLASTPRGASVVANLVVFPLTMLGGCFFPFEWMPNWMARIGRLTPNGWAMTQFRAILDGAVSASHLAVAIAALVLFSAAAFAFALRRLRSGFAS